LSASYLGLSSGYGYFNGDIAGVFVVDEYLSTDATSVIADLMVRGVDLTADTSSAPVGNTSGIEICSTSAYAGGFGEGPTDPHFVLEHWSTLENLFRYRIL
jgi:hypothetical protein